MILQRSSINVGNAGFEPGTSVSEVWRATNEPPHLHEPLHLRIATISTEIYWCSATVPSLCLKSAHVSQLHRNSLVPEIYSCIGYYILSLYRNCTLCRAYPPPMSLSQLHQRYRNGTAWCRYFFAVQLSSLHI